MNLNQAFKLLTEIDSFLGANDSTIDDLLDTDLLVIHNEHYILSIRGLELHKPKLAEKMDELELAAPYIFLVEGCLDPKASALAAKHGFKVKKGGQYDIPFLYYIECENFSFGITD